MTDAAKNQWNRTILAHEPWLRTVVRSRVSAPGEVDDVMQSVMADAIAFADRKSEIQSIAPWLYRLAVNGVLQFRRKCGRRRKLHNGYARSVTSEDLSDPLDLLLGDEQRIQVQAALKGMNGEDVEILMLKYVHGWNYSQLSQQLGLEGHRVAHRLRRARERLKYQLQQQGLGSDEVSGI